jgi:hypothetical protein
MGREISYRSTVPRNLAALVIGNAAYAQVDQLQNPVNDATDMAGRLVTLGFTVQLLPDATTEEMDRALVAFGGVLATSDLGLFFFAGHAFQIDGINFLAGVDTKSSDPMAVKYSALHLDRVVDVMKWAPSASARASIVILDACRNNPFEGYSRSVASNELAPVFAPKGMLIAFSTSPGEKSKDGTGRNGPYTEALLQHITTQDLPIETMFKRVRNTLASLTNGKQTSWEHTSLLGDFHFRLSREAPVLEYDRTAISDGLFVIRENQPGHAVIRGLKILTWDYQNAALRDFDSHQASLCAPNVLFVIGRNIYQAACGGSNAASAFIQRFVENTEGLEDTKRKCLMDGMLFEVFFDPEGQHRARPKMGFFSEVMKLQVHSELAASFAFLTSCLEPYADLYCSLPGSERLITIDVAAELGADGVRHEVRDLWLEGTNVLHDKRELPSSSWFGQDITLDPEQLREFISNELVIPKHLLTVTSNVPETNRIKYVILHTLTMRRDS